MGRRSNILRGAAIGAVAGYTIQKALQGGFGANDQLYLSLPPEDKKDASFKEIYELQRGDQPGWAVAVIVVLCFIFCIPAGIIIQVMIEKGEHAFDGGLMLLGIILFFVAIAMALAYANRRKRMENTIYAYLKYKADELDYQEWEFMRNIPYPSQEAVKKWEARLLEYKRKTEDRGADDDYVPDIELLSYDDMDVIHEHFTRDGNSNLQKYLTWLVTRTPDEREEILNEIKRRVNDVKVMRYNEAERRKRLRKK